MADTKLGSKPSKSRDKQRHVCKPSDGTDHRYESETPLLCENGTPVISSTILETPKSAISGLPKESMTILDCKDEI